MAAAAPACGLFVGDPDSVACAGLGSFAGEVVGRSDGGNIFYGAGEFGRGDGGVYFGEVEGVKLIRHGYPRT